MNAYVPCFMYGIHRFCQIAGFRGQAAVRRRFNHFACIGLRVKGVIDSLLQPALRLEVPNRASENHKFPDYQKKKQNRLLLKQ